MSKLFNQISLGELNLTDTLPLGKLKGCRICDIIEDDYEYVVWLERNGYIKLSQEVITKAQSCKSAADAEQYIREEVDPWDSFDDIPW